MFGLGYVEMLIVGIVAVLLFGGRLPQVARSMGRSLTEFKKGMSDLQGEVDDAIYSEPAKEVDYDRKPSAPRFEPPTSPPKPDDPATETSNMAGA